MGKATFEVPKGWDVAEGEGGGWLLTRQYPKTDDIEQGAAIIQILKVDGNPTNLAANLAEMVGWIDGMSEEDPMIDSYGKTLNGHDIRVEMRCCGYTNDISMVQTVAGIASDDQQFFAAMVFMNSSSDHEDAADLDYEALIRSVRFEGDTIDTITPQNGDGGLEGVYTHHSFGLMPNVFGGLDMQSDSEILVLDKGGLFSNAIPQNGSIAEHCAANPVDCGTYKLTGGGFWMGGDRTMEMHSMVDSYGVMETETLSLEQDGDDLKIDDGDYYRLPPFDSGTTFDGSWTYTWASSGMTATTSGSVAVQRTLVFSPDGRFTRDGWSGGSTSGDMGGVTVSTDRPANAGSYEVAGYELILKGDDGNTETLSIFAPDRDSDGLLVINGSNYLKDD